MRGSYRRGRRERQEPTEQTLSAVQDFANGAHVMREAMGDFHLNVQDCVKKIL